MKDFLTNAVVDGILVILLGILLLVNPGGAWTLIFRIIGVVLLIMGVVRIVSSRKGKAENRTSSIVIAVIMMILALVLLIKPEIFIPFVPIVCGIMIGYGAIYTLITNRQKKKMGMPVSTASYILAIVTLVLAVLIIINPSFLANIFMQLVGIALIIAGVTLLISGRANKGKA